MLLCNTLSTLTMELEQQQQKMNLFIIPDSTGQGGQYASNIFPDDKYHISKIEAPMPLTFASFNQRDYENTIEKHINMMNPSNTFFLYALGDGVSFAFDYAVKNPQKVAAILAEGTTLTEKHYIFDLCTKIPNNIPIIMLHNQNDTQAPYSNAVALYHHLKNNLHVVTYCLGLSDSTLSSEIIDPPINNHLDLLKPDINSRHIVNEIYLFLRLHALPHKYGAVDRTGSAIKLESPAIPVQESEKVHLSELIKNENKRYYLELAGKYGLTGAGLILLLVLYKLATG